jgi:phosphate transport system permease protein
LWILLVVVVVALGSFALASARAQSIRKTSATQFHSLPAYHGLLASSFSFTAGIIALLACSYIGLSTEIVAAISILLALAAAAWTMSRINSSYRARPAFETFTKLVLTISAVIAVLTTAGIFASVTFESIAFFNAVNPIGFLFGSNWAPNGTPPSFGFLPLLIGTLLITVIAVGVATPLGLMSAIYMAEYASPRLRNIAKPMLEMLAGIPTVVLGFFAALTVAPFIRNSGEAMGLEVASESALAAGLVMGMMIVPLISSLSDDIINSVPQSLRDGSFAMGATKSETIKRVVLPAALPGLVSAVMLAISRAVGETMIVVMAAGLAANFTVNPLSAVSTITVQIATLLVGDQEFDSPKTLSAFALGLTLFFFTLALNYLALRVVQKYRQQYD